MQDKQNRFYTTDFPLCSKCKSILKKFCVEAVSFWGKEKVIRFYCDDCWQVVKMQGIIEISRIVLIDAKIPKDAFAVVDNKPELSIARGVSVVDAVSDVIAPAEEVIDHTRLAGRESIHGVQIGNPNMTLLEEKDKAMRADEGLIFLDKLAQAELMIPEKAKPQLTADSIYPPEPDEPIFPEPEDPIFPNIKKATEGHHENIE